MRTVLHQAEASREMIRAGKSLKMDPLPVFQGRAKLAVFGFKVAENLVGSAKLFVFRLELFVLTFQLIKRLQSFSHRSDLSLDGRPGFEEGEITLKNPA